MEIEKKFLIDAIPFDLSQYEKWEIEQCYLCKNPTIRIRKKNGEYILTYKSRPKEFEGNKLCVAKEVELPLTKEAYEHLKEKVDGNIITKTRYRIPYREHWIELDVFHGIYEGFLLAEVEFETIEIANSFIAPSWFGEDVSGKYEYTNSFLSQTNAKVV